MDHGGLPMNPRECLGIFFFPLMALRILIVIQYWRITARWLDSAKEHPKNEGAKAWVYQAWVFRFCAMAGYALPAMAVFQPFWFYSFAVIAMIGEVVVSEFFINNSRKKSFIVKDASEAIHRIRRDIEELGPEISASEKLKAVSKILNRAEKG